MKKTYKVSITLSLIAFTVLFFGVVGLMTVFAPCPSGMICKESVKYTIFLFLIAMLCNAGDYLIDRIGKCSLGIIPDLAALIAYMSVLLVVDVFIGGCKKPEMACNTMSFPYIHLVVFFGLILQVMHITLAMRELKKPEESEEEEKKDEVSV